MRICKAWAGDSIPVNRVFMRYFGYKAAVVMAVLIDEMQRTNGKEFTLSHEKIREMTGISYYLQVKILNFFVQQKFLKIEKRGVPFRKYYMINEKRLMNWLAEHGAKMEEAKRPQNKPAVKKATERQAEMRAEMDPATLVFYDRIREKWNIWNEYKRKEHKFRYKSAISEKTAIQSLMKLSGADPVKAGKIIERSIERGWKGLFPLPESRVEPAKKQTHHWDARKNFKIPENAYLKRASV